MWQHQPAGRLGSHQQPKELRQQLCIAGGKAPKEKMVERQGNEVRIGAGVRTVLGVAWALVVTIVLTSMTSNNLLPDGPDKWTYDWRTYFFSTGAPAQRDDIALVVINENSVADYPYNVVDRGLLVELVQALNEAGAKAIGLDFVFERPTEPQKDRALMEAIANSTRPVVLAAIDERARVATSDSLEYQRKFFEQVGVAKDGGVRAGHAFFSRVPGHLTTGDQVVRFISDPLPSSPSRESFARVLADLDGPKPTPSSPYIDWLLPPSNAEDTFATFRVPRHKPGFGKGDTEKVLPSGWRVALKDKIVLVGAEFVDRDRHLTPLSVADKAPVSGVAIQAQILAQLRDGRSIRALHDRAEALTVFTIALLGYALGWRARIHWYRAAHYAIGIVVLAMIGVTLFALWHLIIPTTTVLFAWIAGVSGGHYSGWSIRIPQRLFAGKEA
jgi:CHASE2 domain-containing sensor protein